MKTRLQKKAQLEMALLLDLPLYEILTAFGIELKEKYFVKQNSYGLFDVRRRVLLFFSLRVGKNFPNKSEAVDYLLKFTNLENYLL
ncbi:hypothetical protein N7U66_02010 [Lacinutrix neustonica]|uniref:Uncharacterized protein n=1 Tax=Lacinutrix neustonica TaxID=2980107 RepID=A0A9E8SDV6_9FLAO|nr:hypothetical protein [Lacinutrix neustonica]WAC02511.1 hypothetical protein N7U66_02010 [Lacinutrix neustonica]